MCTSISNKPTICNLSVVARLLYPYLNLGLLTEIERLVIFEMGKLFVCAMAYFNSLVHKNMRQVHGNTMECTFKILLICNKIGRTYSVQL